MLLDTKVRITGLRVAVARLSQVDYAYIYFNTRSMHVWVDPPSAGGYRDHYLENPNNVYIEMQTLDRVSASVGANLGRRKELEAVLLTILTNLRSNQNRAPIGLSNYVKEPQLKAAVKIIDALSEIRSEYYWGYFDIVTHELLVQKRSWDYECPKYASSARMKLFSEPDIKRVGHTLWSGVTTEEVLKELINLLGN